MAWEIEVQETCHLLQEIVHNLLSRGYVDNELTVTYDPLLASFQLKLTYRDRRKGKRYDRILLLREEDVWSHAGSKDQWIQYARGVSRKLRDELNAALKADGVPMIDTRTRLGSSYDTQSQKMRALGQETEILSQSLTSMSDAMKEFSHSFNINLSRAMAPTPEEEAEVIKSIKRSLEKEPPAS